VKAAIVLAGPAVAGCATTAEELRLKEPKAIYTTTRPPSEVAACIAEGFHALGPAAILKVGERTSVTFQASGTTGMAVDIQGGRITVWRLLPYDAEARRRIEACI
jgi:hypothetical protein